MIITNPGPSHTCGVELAEKLLHHLAFTMESIAVRGACGRTMEAPHQPEKSRPS
jgi:hypothetical protein